MKDNCKYCSGHGRDPVDPQDYCPVCLGWGYINYHRDDAQSPLSWKQTLAICALAGAVIFAVLVMGSPL